MDYLVRMEAVVTADSPEDAEDVMMDFSNGEYLFDIIEVKELEHGNVD